MGRECVADDADEEVVEVVPVFDMAKGIVVFVLVYVVLLDDEEVVAVTVFC